MRRSSIRRVNVERRIVERERQFGPLRDYVLSLRCCVCGRWPVEPAHVRGRRNHGAWVVGLDGQLEGNLVPLCPTCHREQHQHGILTFEARHGIRLGSIAARVGREFLAGADVGAPY